MLNPLKIRVRFGFKYMLLDPTPENLALVATLANTPLYDDVYDIEYRKQTYHPVDDVIDVQFDRFSIDDNVTAKDAQQIVDDKRRAAAAVTEATLSLVEAAE